MSIDDNEVLIIGRIEQPKKEGVGFGVDENDGVGFGVDENDENDEIGVYGGNNKRGSKTKRKPIKYSNSKTIKNRLMNGGVKDFDLNAFVQQVLDKYFGLDKETNKCEKHSIDSFECENINHADNLELKKIIPIIYKKTEDRNNAVNGDNTNLVKYFNKIFKFTTPSSNQYLIAQMHHDINNNKLNGIIGIIKFKRNQKDKSIEIKLIERYRVHNNTIHVITSKQLYNPFSNSVVEIIAYPEGSIMNLIQKVYVERDPTLRDIYLTQFLKSIPEADRISLQELLKIKQVNNFQQKMQSIEKTIKKNHQIMKSDLDKLNGVIQTLYDEAKKTNSNNIKNHLNDHNLKGIISRYTDEKKYQEILNASGIETSIRKLENLSRTINVEIKAIDSLYKSPNTNEIPNEIPNKITNRISNKIIEEVTKLDNTYKNEVKQKTAKAKEAKAKKEAEAEAEKKNKIAADKVAKATKVKAKGTGNTTPINLQNQQRPPTLA